MPIDFSLLEDTAVDQSTGGLDSGNAPEPSEAIDWTNLDSILTSKQWLTVSPKKREASVSDGFLKHVDALEKDRTKTVKTTNARGEEIEAPVFNTAGGYTREGLDYIGRVKEAFQVAAKLPDGGAGYDSFGKRYALSDELNNVLAPRRKEPDLFKDMEGFLSEKQAFVTEDKPLAITYDEYVDYANADVKEGEAMLDKENAKMKEEFLRETTRRTFDPGSMGDDEIIRDVAGAYVINPKNYSEVDKVEGAIKALPVDAAQKRMMLIDYRAKVEENIGVIVNDFAAADAGVLGAVVSSPLRDEFMQAMEKPGASGYEFLKANKDRMSKDEYGVGSELAAKLRDATMATGTGALWLAGAAVDLVPGVDGVGKFLSQPAQAWGGLAEDTSKAYHNGVQFSIGGIDITRRDLTELTGQIGSMVGMAGLGSMATKGLTKAAVATGAVQAAEKVGTSAAVGALKKGLSSADEILSKAIGPKKLAFLKEAGSDTTAYFGGVQAAGMSFGSTYNEALERTGDRDAAYREASIQGISDGLSALIATGLMNRVAPGAERMMGAKEGSLSGSLIQNLRSRSVGREGMKKVQESLASLSDDGVRKAFAADLAKSMNGKARDLGLRGIGMAGDTLAEGVEESLDEFLSSGIQLMVDDSKTWAESDWANIHDKWRDYVKAGILGAFGGAVGGVKGSIQNNIKELGANSRVEQLRGEWDLIKKNVEKFGDHDLMADVDSKAVNVAEFVASDAPVEAKSRALLAAAMGKTTINYEDSIPNAPVEPIEAFAPTSGTMSQPDTSEPSSTSGAAQYEPVTYKKGSGGWMLDQIGVQRPTGKNWKQDMPADISEPRDIGSGAKMEVLTIGGIASAGSRVTKPDGSVVHLSPQESLKYLSENKPSFFSVGAKANRKALYETFNDTTDYTDEWTEPAKQVTTRNADRSQKPATSETNTGNLPKTEGGSPSAATSGSPAVTTQQPSSLPLDQKLTGTAAKLADKLDKKEVTVEQLQEMVAWQQAPESAFNNGPANEESQRNKVGATLLLAARGIPLSPAKTLQPSSSPEGPNASAATVTPEVGISAPVKPLAAEQLTKENEVYYGQSEESRQEIREGVSKRLESDEEVMKHIKVEGKTSGFSVKGVIHVDYGSGLDPLPIEFKGKEQYEIALNHAKETVRDMRPDNESFSISNKNSDAYFETQRNAAKVKSPSTTLASDSSALAKPLSVELSPKTKPLASIGRTDFNGQNGAVAVETTSEKNGKKYMITAEPGTSPSGKSLGRTKWIISGEDSKSPGEYSGSLPMENDTARELAVKALGEEFVQSIENAHKDADENGMDGSERATSAIEQALDKIKSSEPATALSVGKQQTTELDEKDRNRQEASSEAQKGQVLSTQAEPLTAQAKEAQLRQARAKAGNNFLVLDRPERANYPANQGTFGGDENVWVEKSTGKVGVSPSFAEQVMNDPTITKKSEFLASAVKAVVGGKPAPKLNAATMEAESKPTDTASQVNAYHVRPDQLSSSEPDKRGGVWSEDSGVYTYTPKKGSTMQLGVGDVLHIDGNPNEVLVLNSVSEGNYVFLKVDMDRIAQMMLDPQRVKQVNALQSAWTKNRVGKVARMLLGKDTDAFGRLVAGTFTADEMSKVFDAALKVVAPDMHPSQVVRKKLPGTDYMQVAMVKRGGSLVPVLQVDMAKLAEQLRKPFQNANLSHKNSRQLLSLEAARILSALIDEEQIHMITLDQEKFGADELESFYREIWDNKKHSFHELLRSVVAARFPNADPNPDVDIPNSIAAADDYNGIYSAASELIRIIHQRRIGGSESERVVADARELTNAINAESGDKGAKGLVKAVASLLKRYSARIRRVLHMRWIMGRLPESHRKLLARLDDEYMRRNVRGDVDLIQEKITNSYRMRSRLFASKTEEEVNKIASKHSEALITLRRKLPGMFSNLKLDDIMVVDDETQAIDINPKLREHIEQHSSLKIDLPAIDEALAALNDMTEHRDGTMSFGATSYQKAMVQTFLAKEVMESAREEVEMDSRAFYEWMNGGGITSDPRGIDSFLVANAPTDYAAIEQHSTVRAMRAEHQRTQKQIEESERGMALDAVREVANADPSKIDGWKTIFRYARMMGFQFDANSLGKDGTWRNMEALKNHVQAMVNMTVGDTPTRFADQQSKSYKEYKELLTKEVRQSDNQRALLGAFNEALDASVGKDKEGVSTSATSHLADRAATLEKNASAAQNIREAAQLRRSAALLRAMVGKDMAVANERYDKFKAFLDSVDAYNKAVRTVIQRAVGNFDNYSDQDYGIRFTDTKHDGMEADDIRRLNPLNGVQELDEAKDPASVFGFPYRTAKESLNGGETPGWSYAKNPHKDDTEEVKEFKRRYKFTLESNAAFTGRSAWMAFALDEMLGKFPASVDLEWYSQTAGFNFEQQVNVDLDKVEYETEDEAFRDFDGLDALFKTNDAFKEMLEKGGQSSDSIVEGYLEFLHKADKWSRHIRRRVTNITPEIDGKQTLAGREALLLLPRLIEFETLLSKAKTDLTVTLADSLFIGNSMDAYGRENFAERFERHTEGDKKGKLKLKPGTNFGLINTAIRQGIAPLANTGGFSELQESTFLLKHAVKLTRKALREFRSPAWRDNVEHEMGRTIRDDAYVPDHKELLVLRDQEIDLRTVHNMAFILQYHEDPKGYRVGASFAMDALEEHRKANRGDGGGKFVKKKATITREVLGYLPDAQEVFDLAESYLDGESELRSSFRPATESDLPSEIVFRPESKNKYVVKDRKTGNVEVVVTNELAPLVRRDVVVISKSNNGRHTIFFDKDGQAHYTRNVISGQVVEPIQDDDIVSDVDSLDVDGRPIPGFGLGDNSNTVEGFRREAVGEYDIAANSALRQQGQAAQARKKWISRWGMLIGYQSRTKNGNAQHAKQFLHDVINQGKQGSDPMALYDLIARGLAGTFPMVTRGSINFETLQDQFIEKNPDYLLGNETGSFADLNRFDPEKFLVDLLEFKSEFERKSVDVIRVTNQDKLSGALATVLREATAGGRNQPLHDTFKDFNDAYRNEYGHDILGVDAKPSRFTSDEEVATIAKLIHRGMTGDKRIGFLDARLMSGEQELSYISENPMVSLLLQNAFGGDVVVVIGESAELWKAGGGSVSIGLRVFPGRNGSPTVIFSPQDQNAPMANAGENESAITHALLSYANQPGLEQQLADMAGLIREALDPAIAAGRVLDIMARSNDGLKRKELRRLSVARLVLAKKMENHQAIKRHKAQLAKLDSLDRKAFREALGNHVLRMAKFSRAIGLTRQSASSSNLFDGPSTVVDNAMLVAAVLTNPTLKGVFDQAYVGVDDARSDLLSENQSNALGVALEFLTSQAEDNTSPYYEDRGEHQIADEWDLVINNDEDLEEFHEYDYDTTPGLDAAPTIGDALNEMADDMQEVFSEETDDFDIRATGNTGPNVKVLNDMLAKFLGVELQKKNPTVDDNVNWTEKVVWPSDAALFNALAGIIATAKQGNGVLSEEAMTALQLEAGDKVGNQYGKLSRDMLKAQSGESMGGPIIDTRNRKADVYSGEMHRSTLPRGIGGTMQTRNWNHARRLNAQSSMIGALPSVKDDVNQKAIVTIQNELRDNPNRRGFSQIRHEVVLTDFIMDEIVDSFPEGMIQRELEDVDRMLRGLSVNRDNWLEQEQVALSKLAEMDAPLNPEQVQEFLGNADMQSQTMREQIANWTIGFVRSFVDGTGRTKVTLANVQAARLASTLNNRFEKGWVRGLSDSLHKHLFELTNLIKQRDSLEAGRDGETVLANTYVEGSVAEINAAIAQRVKSYNTTAGILNHLVTREANQVLKETNKAAIKLKNWVPQFKGAGLDASNINLEAVRGLSRSISSALSRPKIGKVFANQIVRDVVADVADKIGKSVNMQAGTPNNAMVKVLTNLAERARFETIGRKEIAALLDNAFNKVDVGEDEAGIFSDFLKQISLTSAEARELIRSRVETLDQRVKRDRLKQTAKDARKQADAINAELQRIMANDGNYELGRYHHNTTVGLPEEAANVAGKKLTRIKGIQPEPRKIQVHLSLVHPDMQGLGDQKAVQRAKTTNAYNESDASRREFYVRSMAVKRALDKLTDERLDEAYKKIRGRSENFNSFNPIEMIKESIRIVDLEKALLKDRFNETKTAAEKAEQRGLSIEAIAMATAPEMGNDIYVEEKGSLENRIKHRKFENYPAPENLEASVRERMQTAKGRRVRKYRAPENWSDRIDLIGRLFDDGAPIALVSTTAKEQLMQRFPDRVTKKTVNRDLSGLVLRAMDLGEENGKDIPVSFRLGFGNTEETEGNPFNRKGFALAKGEPITRRNAVSYFQGKFGDHMKKYLEAAKNGGRPRGRTVDLKGRNTENAMSIYNSMIEQMVMFYDTIKLGPELNEKVGKFLKTLENGSFAMSDQAMTDFDIVDLFSEVFAEVHSDYVMETLASGLSIQTEKFVQGMMKIVHHHDARTRMRLMKSFQARQVAQYMQGLLDDGFDGKSGRIGAERAKRESQTRIAEAAGKIKGGNALDQTIGYLMAQLDGINDAVGMSKAVALGSWMNDINHGYKQLLQLDKAQKSAMGRVGRFFNANHIDLIRDLPLAKKVRDILEESKISSEYGALKLGLVTDDEAQILIDAAKKAFMNAASDKANTENYSKVIHKEFSDMATAMNFSRAILSKPQQTLEENEEYSNWKNKEVRPIRNMYSSVPMRLAYAANPNAAKNKVATEGNYIGDPIDIVALQDSSFFGGYGRHEANTKESSVFRPVAMNGLSAPLSLLDDATYRMNVAPNYEVLRRLTGKVEMKNGIPYVDPKEAKLLSSDMQEREGWDKESKEYRVALASIASESEQILLNDSQRGVVNTQFAELGRFLASTYVVRALSSVQQMVNQTIPPVIGFTTKALATGQYRMAGDFLISLGRLLPSAVSYTMSRKNPSEAIDPRDAGKFFLDTKDFVKNVSLAIHYRSMDGQDVVRNELRGQMRYGAGVTKGWAGKLLKEYENLGENVLDFTIGMGERMVSRSIFLAELMSEMRSELGDPKDGGTAPATIDELLQLSSDQIPIAVKQYAQTKVSDMMGQSDMAKKSLLFQSHSTSPVWGALLKSMVRFSNYSATTASNLSAWMPVMRDFIPGTTRQYDDRTRREAVENVIGTLSQNLVFHVVKLQTSIPLLLSLMYWMGGDDKDEAVEKAQEKADYLLASDEDSGMLAGLAKDVLVGRKRQLFTDTKDAEAARASAVAELSAKAMVELSQAIPYVGVLAGYSPVNAMVRGLVADRTSESLVAKAYGLEPDEERWSPDGVGVREYKPGVFESIMEATAPTSVAYDGVSSLGLAYDAWRTDEANPMQITGYLIGEVIAPLRDYRGARQKELQQIVRDYGDEE